MTHDELISKHSRILSSARNLWVQEGWYPLIDKLCQYLQNSQRSDEPQIVAVQVKEKFGGLRFYVDNASKEQMDIIDKAEALSYKTCEVCGEEGKHYSPRGWIKTRCKEHENV